MARGQPSNRRPTPPRLVLSPATLLECMMVKRVEQSSYKKSGPELPVSIWEPEGDGFVWVRLDMPGANSVVVYSDPNEKCIKYKGVEQEITMHGIGKVEDCRTYEGCLFLDPARFLDVIDFTYEFWNGILLLKIRCARPASSADLGVQIMIHNQPEEMKESAYNPLVSQGTDRYRLHGFNNEDEAFFMAVDMPGIGEEDKVTIHGLPESGSINFFAEEKGPLSLAYGESLYEPRREYHGLLKVNLEEFNPKEAEFEINHGVLWILVPRALKTSTDSITIFPADSNLEEITPYSRSLLD